MSIPPQEVLKVFNLARQYPKYYIRLIDDQLNSFIDDVNIKIDEEVVYQTIQGKNAWLEAKEFLNQQKPLRPFDHHEGLFKSSQDHVQDIMNSGSSGHIGLDGSTFIDRLQRYSKKGKGSMIQLLGTTYLINNKNSIELALINLIVDDGVSNRGHRKALFNSDYKYMGACFVENQEKIYSVIAMSQSNLEELKQAPQNIATSTSNLKSSNNTQTQLKAPSVKSSKENIIDQSEEYSEKEIISVPKAEPVKQQRKSFKISVNNDQMWTLKNVTNTHEKPASRRSTISRESIPQKLEAQPSIFKDIEQSSSSKNSIGNYDAVNQKPVKEVRQPRKSKKSQSSQSHIKENSLKMSQHSVQSEGKERSTGVQGAFGLSSNVEEFKLKSTFNSPFLKTNTSGFGVSNAKKVVQKKQSMRTWNQDEFLIKQVTTVFKYNDGSCQDWVEKHSVLKE